MRLNSTNTLLRIFLASRRLGYIVAPVVTQSARQSANDANETYEYIPSLASSTSFQAKAQWQAVSNTFMVNHHFSLKSQLGLRHNANRRVCRSSSPIWCQCSYRCSQFRWRLSNPLGCVETPCTTSELWASVMSMSLPRSYVSYSYASL